MDMSEVRPVGRLNDILATFGAPERVGKVVARRVGDIVGIPGGLSHQDVNDAIVENLHNGIPNWQGVVETLVDWRKDVLKIRW